MFILAPWLYIATIYEVILFGFAIYKYLTARDITRYPAMKKMMILSTILVNDNILYFLGYESCFLHLGSATWRIFRVTIVLVLNNLEVSVSRSLFWMKTYRIHLDFRVKHIYRGSVMGKYITLPSQLRSNISQTILCLAWHNDNSNASTSSQEYFAGRQTGRRRGWSQLDYRSIPQWSLYVRIYL